MNRRFIVLPILALLLTTTLFMGCLGETKTDTEGWELEEHERYIEGDLRVAFYSIRGNGKHIDTEDLYIKWEDWLFIKFDMKMGEMSVEHSTGDVVMEDTSTGNLYSEWAMYWDSTVPEFLYIDLGNDGLTDGDYMTIKIGYLPTESHDSLKKIEFGTVSSRAGEDSEILFAIEGSDHTTGYI